MARSTISFTAGGTVWWDVFKETYSYQSVSDESAMKEFPAMYTPITPAAIEAARQPVGRAASAFGHSFTVSGSYTSPASTGGKTWKSEYKLIFKVCPTAAGTFAPADLLVHVLIPRLDGYTVGAPWPPRSI